MYVFLSYLNLQSLERRLEIKGTLVKCHRTNSEGRLVLLTQSLHCHNLTRQMLFCVLVYLNIH